MRSTPRPSWTRASFRLAARLVLLLPVALGAWGGEVAPALQTYTTGIGELRRVVLGQHAVANLNTRTVITVVRTPNSCEIELKSGEALFDIRRNDARRVHLTAGRVRVDADASAFSVRLREPDQVDVLVRRGGVTLAILSETFNLTVNHKVQVSPKGVTLEPIDEAEMQRRFQWTTGYLSFEGETLEEVAEEFNRYNPQRLVVEDGAIRQLRIGGNYNSTDPEGFAAALRPMGVRRVDSVPTDASAGLIRLVGTRAAR